MWALLLLPTRSALPCCFYPFARVSGDAFLPRLRVDRSPCRVPPPGSPFHPSCLFVSPFAFLPLPVPLHPLSRVVRIYFRALLDAHWLQPVQVRIHSAGLRVRVCLHVCILFCSYLYTLLQSPNCGQQHHRVNRVQKLGGLKTGGVDSLKPR